MSKRLKTAFVLATVVGAMLSCDTSELILSVNDVPVTLSIAVRGSLVEVAEPTLDVGDSVALGAVLYNALGQPTGGGGISWSSSDPNVATVSSAGLVRAISPGICLVTASADGLSAQMPILVRDTSSTATANETPHEPPGFTQVIEDSFDGLTPPNWLVTPHLSPANTFTTPLRDGDNALTYVFPSGYSGDGDHTGSTYDWIGSLGPVLYARLIVGFSPNFVGHSSSINKMFYHFNKGLDNGTHFLIADGSGTGDLFLRWAWVGNGLGNAIGASAFMWNGQFGGAGSYTNAARPTIGEATIRRGEKVVIEELVSYGTPGQSDGWFKIWMNGVLTHDYSGLPILTTVSSSTYQYFSQFQIAPVYGGRAPNPTIPSPDQRFWVFDVYLSQSAK